MATTFTLISSTTVGSGGVASVTFSSIPTSYNDLMLFSSTRISVGSRYDSLMRMNSVTTNYRYIFAEGYSTNSLYTSQSNSYGGQDVTSNPVDHTANYFTTSQIYICNYNSTAVKPTSYYQSDTNNSATNFYLQTGTGIFPSSAAINSLTITPNSGSYLEFSSFHLYGISYT